MKARAHLQKAKSGSSMASCRASRLSSKLYRVTSMATTRGLLPHSLAPTSDGDVHDEPSEGPREIRNRTRFAWRSLKVPKCARGQSPVRGQRGSRRDAPAGRRGRHPLPVMDTMAETTPVPPVFAVRPFPDPDLPISPLPAGCPQVQVHVRESSDVTSDASPSSSLIFRLATSVRWTPTSNPSSNPSRPHSAPPRELRDRRTASVTRFPAARPAPSWSGT